MNAIASVAEFRKQLQTANQKAAEASNYTKIPLVKASRGRIYLPNGQPAPNGNVEAVVLAVKYAKNFYETAYDPNSKAPPSCSAEAWSEDSLFPSARSTNVQCESCAACPKNQFRKDETSNRWLRKECTDHLRLAIITPESFETNEIWELRVPPASISNWRDYNKYVVDSGKNLWDQLTTIELDPNETKYDKLAFSGEKAVNLGDIDPVLERVLYLFSQ